MNEENNILEQDVMSDVQEQNFEDTDYQEPIEDEGAEPEDIEGAEQEPQYYSMEELESLSEDEIDADRLPPFLNKLVSKLNKQERSLDDEIEEAGSKAAQTEAKQAGLSLNEYLQVKNEAKNHVKAYLEANGIDFDEYDEKHQELVSVKQKELTEMYSEIKHNQRAVSKATQNIQTKYGKDYAAINDIVDKYINDEIPYSKREKILSAVRAGNTDIFYSVYNMAAKRFYGKTSNAKQQTKKTIFPPNSIVSGTKYKNEKAKTLSEEKGLLWEEPKWHKI